MPPCTARRYDAADADPTTPDHVKRLEERLASAPAGGRMSLRALWSYLGIALPVLAALLVGLSSVDLAYHLRAGAELLDRGAIPSSDSWTFTVAGQPWLDQQWAAQGLLAAVERAAGWSGLALLRAALVGAIFGGLAVVCTRRGIDSRTTTLLSLAAFFVSAPALGLRPQLLGMALFVLILVIASERRTHPRWMWFVPIVVAVWANLHGSFFLGPLAVGLYWLQDVHDRWPGARRTLAVAVVSGLAACLTPFGPSVWVYAVGLSSNPEVTRRITEWQPTSLRDVPGLLFYASVIGVVALLARRGRSAPWPTLAWLGFFFVIGAYAIRGVAWWPLAAVVAVVGLLDSMGRERAVRPEHRTARRLNAIVALVLAAAGVALLPMWRPQDPGLRTPAGVVGNAPPGITAVLRTMAKPGDHLFAPQPWGSWFEYALPGLPVALDSRIELFPASVWDDYDRVVAGGDGWQDRLQTWNVSLVVIGPEDDAFAGRLVHAGWEQTYRDADGAVFVSPH